MDHLLSNDKESGSAKRALLEALLKKKGIRIEPAISKTASEVLPLSFAQERLWFLDQLDPGNSAYHISIIFRLSGHLDVTALERAVGEIVRRHEALRATFVVEDGKPTQVIAPPRGLSLPVLNLPDIPKARDEEELQRIIAEQDRRPFDLSQGPLLRAVLLRTRPAEHVFLLVMHHIVSDAWSMEILAKELATLYDAYSAGESSPLPELPIQYADYAVWQREWLQGDVLERQLAYWKGRLAGAPSLELPTVRPRPPAQTHIGAKVEFGVSLDLAESMRKLCQREEVTLFMALLTVFKVLLHRYTGQEDIVVGTPISGRNRVETDNLIGFFLNTLALRTDLSGNPSFRELLGGMRKVALEAYAHQDLPFEKLVEELQPERDLSRSPLFQVMFAFQHAPRQSWKLSGLSLSREKVESGSAKFDLTLSIRETAANGLQGTFCYRTDLFDEAMIERLAGHFVRLLDGVIANPETRVGELPLLTGLEQEQILVHWNDTQRDYDEQLCIHELFTEQARRRPERLAIVCEQEQISYRELNERANRLAHYLRELGVGPEVIVGICLERSIEMMVGLLGILKAGGAYVPMDPTYPGERLNMMVEDADIRLLLTQECLAERFPYRSVKLICLDRDWRAISSRSPEDFRALVEPDNAAYVIYTSGSTGRPKGVIVTHRSLHNLFNAVNERLDFGEDDVWTLFHSYSFDFSVWEMWGALAYGGKLVVAPYLIARTPEEFRDLVHQQSVTILSQTPSAFRQFIKADEIAGASENSSLRAVVFGGEALEFQSLKGWLDSHGDEAPQLINMYGITETTVHTTYKGVKREDLKEASGSVIGKPLANVQMYLLDERMHSAPVGVRGELYISGRGVARGYLGRPELTAERFIPSPFSKTPGARLYKTGDLARYQPDGNLCYIGRDDSQVKVRGYRIELREIEAALVQHPDVREAVVIAHGAEIVGQRLVAYLVANPKPTSLLNELRDFLKKALPEYMLPAAYIMLEALPLTPNGKVDRKQLPDPKLTADPEKYVGPRNEVEEILCSVWSQVLNVESVGVEDNFFHLGGDSILSIQVIARAASRGIRLTPRQLFEYQTIAGLAPVAGRVAEILNEQETVTGPAPLTPIQHWFFEKDLAEPHHYNQSVLLEPRETLNLSALRNAMAHLMAHHDALRFRYVRDETAWRQIASSTDEPACERIDLSAVPMNKQAEVLSSAAEACQASLNLAEGPLTRVVLFDRGRSQPQRLLIVIHHLVIDGVSWRILLEDLETAYRQLIAGASAQLPAKTTSFARWAQYLSEHVRQPGQRSDLDLWLADAEAEVAVLPTDGPGGPNTLESERKVDLSLSMAETHALVHQVPKAYNTRIEDLLLTALAQACFQWTGHPVLRIALERHGREALTERLDVSRTVGWFTSLHPVRLDLRGVTSDGEALKTVKEQLRRPPIGGLGYGLWRYLSGERAVVSQLQRCPEPELCFNYLGHFDQTFAPTTLFRATSEPQGSSRSPRNIRRYSLEISGRIVGNQLRLVWRYSKRLHQSETIERLATSHLNAIRNLVTHCQSPEAGGYTPSDLPGARISEQDLAVLLQAVNH